MKVILTQDVKAQGMKGQLIEVSDGYARNFLLPKGLAVVAGAKAINEMKNKEEAKQYKLEAEKREAQNLAEKLDSFIVKVMISAGADGRLYGSVTSKEIAELLQQQHGIELDKRKIILDEPIKVLGQYQLDVKLFAGITGKLNIIVTDKKQ